jgi:cytochrome c556
MSRWSLLAVVAASLGIVACHPPKREVTPEQVAGLSKLGDVMDAQATYADPMFKKRDQAAFTDAEFASFTDAAQRLLATSLKIKDFSKGPAFDALAVQLNAHVGELNTAAQAKDANATRTALAAMKATCKECHSKFR